MKDVTTTAPAEKPKRISKKVRNAIGAMVAGEAKSIADAARIVDLSREHLSRELGRPHIAALLRDKVMRNLAISSAKAGATKVQLLDSPNEMVRDRASSFILGLSGISPETATATLQPGLPRAGLVIVIENGTSEPKVIDASVNGVSGLKVLDPPKM